MPQQKHTHTHTHTRILLFLLLPCFGQSDDSEESSLRSACGRLLISGSFSQSSAVSCTTLHSHKEDPLLQWRDANDLGMAHYILGDVDAAIDYFDNALLHAKPNILAPLRNIAWAYQAHHRPLDAANAWKRVAKEVGDLVFWGGEHPSRVLRANQGALTFEDIPSVGKLCQWPGFAKTSRKNGRQRGGEALAFENDPIGLYLDLLVRAVSQKTSRSGGLDDVLEANHKVRGHSCEQGTCEMPWDLSWSSRFYQTATFNSDPDCPSHPASGLSVCEATPMAAGHLTALRLLAEQVLRNKVKGDFLEAGVFRGGMSVILRGVLVAHESSERASGRQRRVIAADSFEGIPEGVELGMNLDEVLVAMEHDDDVPLSAAKIANSDWTRRFKAGDEHLKSHLRRFGMYDNRTVMLRGYFNESLHGDVAGRIFRSGSENGKIALLRIDCDAFESVTDVLEALYDRVPQGGIVIVDDMHVVAVQRAVLSFRNRRREEMRKSPLLPIFVDHVYGCDPGDLPPDTDLVGEKQRDIYYPHASFRVMPNAAFWVK